MRSLATWVRDEYVFGPMRVWAAAVSAVREIEIVMNLLARARAMLGSFAGPRPPPVA